MSKEKLIEMLEDLATFFALAAKDASEKKAIAWRKYNSTIASVNEVREAVYNIAFKKLDKIITEAKK